MEVFINVVGQKLRIATNCKTFVEGTMNFVKFTFILSDDWASLEKKAQFIQDGEAINRELDGNNSVYLPYRIDGKDWDYVFATVEEMKQYLGIK